MKILKEYINFYYNYFIKEDFDILKKWAIPIIKPAWFINSILRWMISPLGFPFFYLYKKNEIKIKNLIDELLKEI